MLRIYLGDLTHTTITISNDSFPLNVGMIAAYAKGFYPDANIRIFKYPEKLLEVLIQESSLCIKSREKVAVAYD